MRTKIFFTTCLVIATCFTSTTFAKKANSINFFKEQIQSPTNGSISKFSLSSSSAEDKEKMCYQAAANLKTFIPKMMKLVEEKVDRSNPAEMKKYTKFKNSYDNLGNASTSQLISECKKDTRNKGFYHCAANAEQTELFIACVAMPRDKRAIQ